MASGKFSFIFISVLSIAVFILLHGITDSKEFRRSSACYDDTFTLECGSSYRIAIHEAYFTSDPVENLTCHLPAPTEEDYIDEELITPPTNYSACFEDLRISLNKKCSGVTNCNFTYLEEQEKLCGDYQGSILVVYDCFKESLLNKYCNVRIDTYLQPRGYISSPGFPYYYPDLKSCSWTIEGFDGQTILLKILHLHMRSPVDLRPTATDLESMYALGIIGQLTTEPMTRCDNDALTLFEGNVRKLMVCGQKLSDLETVELDAGKGVEAVFKSIQLLPFSGFLMYYKVQGCPTIPLSEGSYLAERNGSYAIYSCSNDLVFNDTQDSHRFLQCIRNHHWNDTLPPCTAMEETTTILSPNTILETTEFENVTVLDTNVTSSPVQLGASYLEDILIPSILIGALLLGNTIILIIICCIRRRHKESLEAETEDLTEQKSEPLVTEIKEV